MKWFRWHLGTCEDAKFRLVARLANGTLGNVLGTWAALLEDAANLKHRGTSIQPSEYFGALLDISSSDADMILHAMVQVGLLTIDDGWRVTNWDERQFETDTLDATNAERKRRWRKKHGTAPERVRTVSERPDTDTDTDNIYAQKLDLEFEKFWKDYPRRVSKQAALRSFKTARKSASFDSIMAGLAAAKLRDHRFSDEKFTPYPASWLNAGGYVDHEAQPEVETDLEYDDVLKTWKWKAGRQPAQN